jgi:photosystem II stability/assembly factor-like uncharacterized protein
MSGVRVLVGTRKGAFTLESDGKREKWEVNGPHFGGWEIYHLKGSPADPNRLYTSQSSGWFGQLIQRSNDGGKTWQPVGNKFSYDGVPGTHQWYDGTPHPWEFKRVWHLEPSLKDPDTVYAGVEDAAMFRTKDGGQTWEELSGLRGHGSGPRWQPGAGGLCLHSVVPWPGEPDRLAVGISAGGVWLTDDGGATWRSGNEGIVARYVPDDTPPDEVAFCVHRLRRAPTRPERIFMQFHGGVYRSDDAGATWADIGAGLPSDFGFALAVDPADPDSAYVIPLSADVDRVTPDGRVRVYETRDAGASWTPRGDGLPHEHAYLTILREAFDWTGEGDALELYFGATSGEVFGSADAGASWFGAATHLPPVLSVTVSRT